MSNTASIEEITSYIKDNYLTIEQLANRSGISLHQIEKLISNNCIPKHSHAITKHVIFYTDIFGESVFVDEEIFYYHHSLIKLAMKANHYLEISNYIDVASKMKSDFTNEIREALVEIDDAQQIFGYCFNDDGDLLAGGIEKLMTEHWAYIMDGTYGVCLKEISAKDVILKNIAVSILEEWINCPNQEKNHLYDRARYAAKLYDRVASYFGPHEILKSTRDRLFNKFNSSLNKVIMENTIEIQVPEKFNFDKTIRLIQRGTDDPT